MKAIRCHQGSIVLDDNAADPSPAPGEAVVEPTLLAIDPNDAHTVTPGFSGVLGHEFVGRVVEIDAPKEHASHARLTGSRVVASAHIPCGSCDRCRGGLSLHCAHASTLGLDNRDGCFAQRFTIPITNLVPIPDALDDDRAIFASTLGRVLHAARMLRLEGKTFVSVLGDGPIALLAAQVMAGRNASVRLLGTHEANMELCTKWGVKHRAQHEVGRRQDQDIVFDCEGSPDSLAMAMGLVRPRGSVVLMRATLAATTTNSSSGTGVPPVSESSGTGVPPVSPSGAGVPPVIDTTSIIRDEVQLLGSRGCAIAEAVAELAAARVDVLGLIARKLRFEDGPRAIMAANKPSTLKILLDAA